MFRLLLSLTVCLGVATAIPARAQEGGYGGMGGMGGAGDAGAGLSNALTKRLVRTLKRDFDVCSRFEKVYRYDCYRQAYGLAANKLIGRPAYGEIRQVLVDVETSIERIVARNEDRQAPRKRRGVQTFRAVKPASLPKAKAELIQTLDQAETKLLRASTDRTQVHYARVAEAINSNKVLLRSALLHLRGLLRRLI